MSTPSQYGEDLSQRMEIDKKRTALPETIGEIQNRIMNLKELMARPQSDIIPFTVPEYMIKGKEEECIRLYKSTISEIITMLEKFINRYSVDMSEFLAKGLLGKSYATQSTDNPDDFFLTSATPDFLEPKTLLEHQNDYEKVYPVLVLQNNNELKQFVLETLIDYFNYQTFKENFGITTKDSELKAKLKEFFQTKASRDNIKTIEMIVKRILLDLDEDDESIDLNNEKATLFLLSMKNYIKQFRDMIVSQTRLLCKDLFANTIAGYGSATFLYETHLELKKMSQNPPQNK